MGIFDKIKQTAAKVKIASSVGRIIVTGKGGKVLEKIDSKSDAAIKILEAIELAKELIKK